MKGQAPMKATITYFLSEAGQKASLLSGGDGKSSQTIEVSQGSLSFTRLVNMGNISSEGNVSLEIYSHRHRFDFPQNAAQLLDWVDAKQEEEKKKEEQEKAQAREDTLTVLRERKVKIAKMVALGGKEFSYYHPDWPYNPDKEVLASPEAQEWIQECVKAEEKARDDCKAETLAEEGRRQEKAQKAAEAEAKRRADLGLEENDIDLDIEDGALAEVPPDCWESHSRGKNWLAIIGVDPSSPGGLSRDFLPKARGSSYYLLSTLQAGDPIEFGADYYTGGGRKSPHRWYGFVVRVEPTYIVLRECKGGKSAVKAAKKWAETHTPLPVEDAIAQGIARVNGEGAIVPSES